MLTDHFNSFPFLCFYVILNSSGHFSTCFFKWTTHSCKNLVDKLGNFDQTSKIVGMY